MCVLLPQGPGPPHGMFTMPTFPKNFYKNVLYKNFKGCPGRESSIGPPYYMPSANEPLFPCWWIPCKSAARRKKDDAEQNVKNSRGTSKAAGKVKIRIRKQSLSSARNTLANSNETNSFILQRVAKDLCTDCRDQHHNLLEDSGFFILLAALHWFIVGVIGAEVTMGSTQLAMGPCSLMRRRDERVANYSAALYWEQPAKEENEWPPAFVSSLHQEAVKGRQLVLRVGGFFTKLLQ